MTSVENKLDSFGCWWVISELTNINENNDNLQYDKLIGSLVLHVRATCNWCAKEICHIESLVVYVKAFCDHYGKWNGFVCLLVTHVKVNKY